MNIITYSDHDDQTIQHFKDKILVDGSIDQLFLLKKIEKCPFNLHIIGLHHDRHYLSGQHSVDDVILNGLHEAWSVLQNGFSEENEKIVSANSLINNVSEACANKHEIARIILRRYKNDNNNTYFLFLIKYIENIKFEYLLLFFRSLCNLWQVDIGRIPLHASGVVISDELLLFSGPSHAGKSTIAKLLTKCGGEILDEDQVMIKKTNGGYSANAWGYSLKTLNKPIRGFFKIVQDDHDELIKIPQPNMARFICEQSFEVTGGFLPDDLHTNLFGRICQFARDIPCYELHFTKSPEFWKLIEKELHI